MNRLRHPHSSNAFTFVEVLAAMVFMGILIPVVVSALTLSNRAAVTSEREAIAMQLAENKLGELMIDNAWTSAGARGDFAPNRPGYRWEISQADWESGTMTEFTIRVFFQVQGREESVLLSTLVNESLTQEQ